MTDKKYPASWTQFLIDWVCNMGHAPVDESTVVHYTKLGYAIDFDTGDVVRVLEEYDSPPKRVAPRLVKCVDAGHDVVERTDIYNNIQYCQTCRHRT